MHLILYLFLSSAFVCTSLCQRPQMSIKNLTEVENNRAKPKSDDPLKKEIRKYLRECGADIDISDEDEEKSEEQTSEPQNGHWGYENDGNKKDKKTRGSYPTHYGNRGGDKGGDDCEDDGDDEDSRQTNRNKGRKKMYRSSQLVETFNTSDSNFEHYRDRNNNNNNKRRNKNKHQDDYDQSEEDGNCDDDDNSNNRNKYGGNRNGNRNRGNSNSNSNNNRRGNNNNNRGGMGYGGNRYGNEGNRYGGDPYGNRYGNNDDFGMYDAWGGNRGYNIYGGRLMRVYNITEEPAAPRSKRDANRDDDVQCMSQCVFGYLEMLDDNRVPSETEVVKYFQSNIRDGTKRMQTVREARRCFAKLASTDNDDGCAFSKALAKCLNLDINDRS